MSSTVNNNISIKIILFYCKINYKLNGVHDDEWLHRANTLATMATKQKDIDEPACSDTHCKSVLADSSTNNVVVVITIFLVMCSILAYMAACIYVHSDGSNTIP